ncbi:MAG: helix-turn-helix transcriptional regulator [Proteobacteria bacterium]|nr:helix-turn-helix transcriptional regulator [Pseudomonadota bacterium]
MQAVNREGPDPIDVAVGARVRIRRRWLGLSQTQLANALGITFQQVQKYERGANRVSASMLVKIAAKLETTVAALVGEDGSAPVEAIIYAQLATPGATDLLAAFAKISDGEARRAVLTIAQSLSGEGAASRAHAAA